MTGSTDRSNEATEGTQFLRLTSDMAVKTLKCGELAEAERLQASITAWENLELIYEQVGILLARRPHRPLWHRARPGT